MVISSLSFYSFLFGRDGRYGCACVCVCIAIRARTLWWPNVDTRALTLSFSPPSSNPNSILYQYMCEFLFRILLLVFSASLSLLLTSRSFYLHSLHCMHTAKRRASRLCIAQLKFKFWCERMRRKIYLGSK